MFEPSILQEGKIQYNFLIQNFIQKFDKYFQIQSLFEILEPQKLTPHSQILNLENLIKRIKKLMKKIQLQFRYLHLFQIQTMSKFQPKQAISILHPKFLLRN